MRKNYLFLLLATFGVASAQVPNGSFEEFIGYGNETRYWGPNPLFIPVSIDLDGTTTSDTIIYEQDISILSFFNNDAHTGNRAMEIRNAFNATKNEDIPGKMILFNEDEGSIIAGGYNSGHAVLDGAVIEGLGFYYKYFPLNNDIAQAKLEIFNSNTESIGTAIVEISGLHSEYTYASSPIQLTSTDEPVFMTVEFSMTNGISKATLGSKLIIDDVTTNNLILSNASLQTTQFSVYPTLASQEINVVKGSNIKNGSYSFDIFTVDGKRTKRQTLDLYENNISKIDISSLSQGIYFIKTNGFTAKFIKK